jgi:hypothetical protein
LETLSDEFYTELVYYISDLSDKVLVVDARVQMNSLVNSTSYNGSTVSCTSTATAPSVGIGIGAGTVDSSLCSSASLALGFDASKYLYADPVYPTPLAHRLLGEYAYSKLRSRW